MADGKVTISTELDNREFESGLSKLGSIAKKGLKATGVAIGAISGALSVAGGAAAKFGAEFEASAAKASTLFGDVAVDTDNLNKKILELSSSTGVAATELNEALYSALSAGIPVTEDMGQATEFLASATKLAKAGFTDIDTALSATAKTLNAYNLGTEEAERIQGILIQTQNKGITTVGELGASLAQVTPTAAAFGVSFENVGAALATMTAQGTPTAQATTQLNSLIAELGKQGTMAQKGLAKAAEGTKYAGMSFKQMMESGASLSDVIVLLQKEADNSGKSLVDMFSSIEAGKSALAIASGGFEKFNSNLSAMGDTAGLVDEAYEKVSNTLEAQSAKLKESVKNLGIAIFQENDTALASAAGFGAEIINRLTSAFSEGGADGLIAEFGNVLADVIMKGVEYLPSFLETGVSILSSVAAGIAKNLPAIVSSGLQIIDTLGRGIVEAIPSLVGKLPEVILSILDYLTENYPKMLESGAEMLTALADGILETIPELLEKLPEIITAFVNFIAQNLPKIASTGVDIVVHLALGMLKAIPSLVSKLPDIIVAIVDGLNALMGSIVDVGKNIVKGLWEGIKSMAGWIGDKIKGFAASIVDKITGAFGRGGGGGRGAGFSSGQAAAMGAAEGTTDGLYSNTAIAKSATKKMAAFNAVNSRMPQLDAAVSRMSPVSVSSPRFGTERALNNAAGMLAMSQNTGASREIVLNLNGREVARGIIPDIRAVDKQTPAIQFT